MMPDTHPSEIELVELVEGELEEAVSAAIAAHVERCETCRSQLALLEAGRSALRALPLLELPPGRLEQALSALPTQEREPGLVRSLLRFRRRLALTLVPAALAVVAVVVGITVATRDGSERRPAAGAETTAAVMEAQEAAPAAEAAAGAAPGESAAAEDTPLESATTGAASERAPGPPFLVAGPVDEVVRLLEDAGLTVMVDGNTVTVTGADPDAVAEALAARPAGDVEVVVGDAG